MTATPTRWRYGAKLRHNWLWPRGLWERELEAAKAAALRTWPYATIVGVEPQPPETGTRWIHETGKGWRPDVPQPRPVHTPTGEPSPGVPANAWWRDRD